MDPIDIGIGVAIITVVGGGVAILLNVTRAALAKWTRPRPAVGPGEAEELRHAITQLAAEVSELHERVDFTERVLASERERGHKQLEGGN